MNGIGYTVVLMYEWNKYGEGLKKTFKRFGVKWNSDKVCQLNKEELMDIYKKFKVDNDLNNSIINSSISGKSGVWESPDCAIKIVMIGGEDIGLLIYKKRSEKDKVWKGFIQYSKDCGALVQLLDENMEVVFRDRVNVELVERINDKDREKKVMIENFIKRCKIGNNGDRFKGDWIRCIENES